MEIKTHFDIGDKVSFIGKPGRIFLVCDIIIHVDDESVPNTHYGLYCTGTNEYIGCVTRYEMYSLEV